MVNAMRIRTVLLVGALAASGCDAAASGARPVHASQSAAVEQQARPIPRLVDLGAGKCIPCKAMAPILEQLRADYIGRLEVTFIDVWQKPDEAGAYRINLIPTQIFYGADGRELARHEGFISREEVLAQWQALGVEL